MGGGRDGLSEDKANLSPQLGLSWGLRLSLAKMNNASITFQAMRYSDVIEQIEHVEVLPFSCLVC